MPLHDYQSAAVKKAVATLAAGESLLLVSPTGSGKSYMQVALHNAMPDTHYQIVPNTDIGVGIAEKLNGAPANLRELSDEAQQRVCESLRVFTSKRLYNLLMSAAVPPPVTLSIDEAHHSTDDTHTTIDALCGNCPRVGWTATAYRGTPQETSKLRARWGIPHTVLSLRNAFACGFIARPDFCIWPLINDDLIEVSNGEFTAKGTDKAVANVLPDIITRLRGLFDGKLWLRPTMLRLSTVAACKLVCDAMNAAGLPALSVTGEDGNRQATFARIVDRSHALCQVRVVGEGVDLPMRVLIDLAPTLSPVLWMQSVGRITRPTDSAPAYIATNHNLTRHAYLWEGLIPASQIRDAQTAWGPEYKPKRRNLARALGFEGFGKFTVSQIPLLNKTLACLYSLQTPDGMHQYAVLLDPTDPTPMYFEKTNTYTGEKATNAAGYDYAEKSFGTWKVIDSIPDADGYVSTKPSPVTPAQLAWWKKSARSRGLDPDFIPNAREFQALPILMNTRGRFQVNPNGGE